MLTTGLLVVTILMAVGCAKQDKPVPKVDLITAAVIGDIEAVNQHIKAGSDLNLKEPSRGSTPLITASVFGKTDVALALIKAGADVNYQNNEGSTALHSAALFCRTEIVEALLNKGAVKDVKNKDGRTPIDSVSLPFEDMKPIYDGLGSALAPAGLVLDYEQIKTARPKIVEMLR